MKGLYSTLATFLMAAASYDAGADNPAASVAEPPHAEVKLPGQAPVVDMPLKGDEPMPTRMKKKGMMKDDVKKEYIKKEPKIEEIMEKEEMKK